MNSSSRTSILSVFLALTAGATTWAAIQATYPVFHVPEKYHAAMGAGDVAFQANRRAQDLVERYHAMLYVGGLGLLTAFFLSAADAMRHRKWFFPPIAAILGAVGGALGGFLGCLVYEYVRREVGQAELKHAIAAQVLLAVPLGLGIGCGLGLAGGRISNTAKSALMGAAAGLLAGVIYPVAVSIVLPAASTETLMPDAKLSLLLWLTTVCALVGLLHPATGPHVASENRTASPT